MFPGLICVAKCSSLGIQQVLERGIACQQSHVDLEVECDVLAAVVEGCNGTADLVESSLQVFLLPLPEDVVDVAVVEVEEGVWYALVRGRLHAHCMITYHQGFPQHFPSFPGYRRRQSDR
jgi:hypothetical protein